MREGAALNPLVFVAMPFGKKWDRTRAYEIDFDDIYERGIKPATARFALECIRADEERSGGIIHLTMFERLLLAEITIVDVTANNPNVFYELGVRHAALPRSTIIIAADEKTLPFDIAIIRAVPYKLEEGRLTDENARALVEALAQRLGDALDEATSKDSPLFHLIPQFPGIQLPHDVTESFRDRARYVDGLRERLDLARRTADCAAIEGVEREVGDIGKVTNPEVLIDIALSYRDVEAWDKLVSLVERMPQAVRDGSATVREQLALALNRRNRPGDRERAKMILEKIVSTDGDSPETCGLLGRIFKDDYVALKMTKPSLALANLDRAIEWYRRGFTADPRDFYPGVNLATLLTIRNTDASRHELRAILPAVSFAVARLGGIRRDDYWQIATVFELAVLGGDWEMAEHSLARMLATQHTDWNVKTTLNNLGLIQEVRPEGLDVGRLDGLMLGLRGALSSAELA
jgi:hypothetical protein